MAQRERSILERAVLAVAEQAAKADAIVDEALDAGLGVEPGHWAHREPAPHHEPAI